MARLRVRPSVLFLVRGPSFSSILLLYFSLTLFPPPPFLPLRSPSLSSYPYLSSPLSLSLSFSSLIIHPPISLASFYFLYASSSLLAPLLAFSLLTLLRTPLLSSVTFSILLLSSSHFSYFFLLFTSSLPLPPSSSSSQSSVHQGAVIPDPKAEYFLYDRVINVMPHSAVPFGLKGTIIGVRGGEIYSGTSEQGTLWS